MTGTNIEPEALGILLRDAMVYFRPFFSTKRLWYYKHFSTWIVDDGPADPTGRLKYIDFENAWAEFAKSLVWRDDG